MKEGIVGAVFAALAIMMWPSEVLAFQTVLQTWPTQRFLQSEQVGVLGVTPPVLLSPIGTLEEGDVVGAIGAGDIDVYIVNEYGYKRLFLNPVIFGFYGHLYGFQDVKNISVDVRDAFGTSGLFRNCETDDERVYGLTVHGEDIGTLHWVNITAEQALAEDPDFFKKVFCINQNEFSWYPVGQSFTSLAQVPDYQRGELVQGDAPEGGFLGELTLDDLTGTGGGGGGGGSGASIEDTWSPTDDCPGGGGRVQGLPTCFMPEDLIGTVWNLVDDNTGEVINKVVCSAVVCGPDGTHRVLLDYPVGATYIQTPFDAGYEGKYYTNGVFETESGSIVQPGQSSFQ